MHCSLMSRSRIGNLHLSGTTTMNVLKAHHASTSSPRFLYSTSLWRVPDPSVWILHAFHLKKVVKSPSPHSEMSQRTWGHAHFSSGISNELLGFWSTLNASNTVKCTSTSTSIRYAADDSLHPTTDTMTVGAVIAPPEMERMVEMKDYVASVVLLDEDTHS